MKPSNSLYSEMVFEHSRRPREFGDPFSMPVQQDGKNPSCGDSVCFGVDTSTPVRVKWNGEGCAICMASASILAEHINAQTYSAADAASLIELARKYLSNEIKTTPFAKYSVFSNIGSFPSRVKCAALSCSALHSAFVNYRPEEYL